MRSPDTQPTLRDIVLIGGGHSHVGVLRRFGMQPQPGLRLTLICTDVHTPYSGMLPGYIAGHYSYDDVHIDLSRLCVATGARLIAAKAIGLDRSQRLVRLEGRPPIRYDWVSINVGSTPNTSAVAGAAQHAVPVKPIAQFNQHWQALLARAQDPATTALTVVVVGAGAGGVELALALQHRLAGMWRSAGRMATLTLHVVGASATVLPTHAPRVQRHFADLLRQRGVQVHLNAPVTQVLADGLVAGGQTLRADTVLWVTQASGPAWLQGTGLALDAQGCVLVTEHLQSITDDRIFAAGDVASLQDRPLEKAGVFAVRMGRPLADNLRAAALGQPLQAWRPQRRWLALIGTGEARAVASRGAFSFGLGLSTGRWMWAYKDWIDQRFMQRFSPAPGAMKMVANSADSASAAADLKLNTDESAQAISAIAMRCGGCGAKVGATVLSRALGSLDVWPQPDVLIGLDAPDDAAVMRVPPGMAMVHTVDFFRSFYDDPFVFGQIAANHALGDIYAMGGRPHSATAIVTVPPGLESVTENLLRQLMSGAVKVLNEAGCPLVGGHTGEGRELALGFAINGLVDEGLSTVLRKGALQPGDALVLTKPIGTGTLFAAHPQGHARGRWIAGALASMVQSNREGAAVLRRFGARSATDLTGFGLLGHLVEMTRPSGVDAQLDLAALPLLDGALECVASGILSSLQPANVRLRRALRNQADFVAHPRYPLLFDPQTAGGLLASVPADQAAACVQALREAGYPHAAVIGQVLPPADELAPITLVG